MKSVVLRLATVSAVGLLSNGVARATITTFYSDVSTVSGSAYFAGSGRPISGSASGFGSAAAFGAPFTAGFSGSVSQIDLAVTYQSGANTFDASIWTDVSGSPGVQVANASWSDLSGVSGGCCAMVAIGVSGVTLTAGTTYFMILQPVSFSGTNFNVWDYNTLGLSSSGQIAFTSSSGPYITGVLGTLPTFDVLGGTSIPEPGSMGLVMAGLAWAIFRRNMGLPKICRTLRRPRGIIS